MSQSATILQELKELNSSLPAGLHPTGYTVPAGYFDGLAAGILQRIKADEAGTPAAELAHLSPFLAGLSKKTPYTVPADYFSGLDPAFAYAEEQDTFDELQKISPLLGGLSKKSPYSIPEGYFDQQVNIPDEKKVAPVVTMTPARRKWYRYAAAASVTIIVALSAAVWLKQSNTTSGPEKPSFAWVESSMKKVSTEDLSKFVDLADLASADMAVAGPPDDIKSLLKNVSDKEIQDFLKDVPVDETDDNDILFN